MSDNNETETVIFVNPAAGPRSKNDLFFDLIPVLKVVPNEYISEPILLVNTDTYNKMVGLGLVKPIAPASK